MSDIYKDLLKMMKEVEKLDTFTISGKKVRASRQTIFLPCDDEKNLIGIDSEVTAFHARKANVPITKSKYVPITPDKVYMMEKPEFDFMRIGSPYPLKKN